MKNYEITERLSHEELIVTAEQLTKEYGNRFYEHSNGGLYLATTVTTINIEGTAYWGMLYHPLEEARLETVHALYHTRPLYEFLDGRFKQVTQLRK